MSIRTTTAPDMPARVCKQCSDPYAPRVGEKRAEFVRRRFCSRSCASRYGHANAARPVPGRRSSTRRPGVVHAPATVDVSDQGWRQKGLCHADPDLWFPEGHAGGRAAKEAAAVQICHTCPVLADGRTWVLSTREPHGVWGGLTEAQRTSLRAGQTDQKGAA